ncbi:MULTISPECIES: hypothetical protein [unclassified Streptomyces]|uniref:hypothetical protein n=1 Tax=unclassified Streptomyces TaxID=2593676 RepID=UPI0034282BF0
MRALVAAGLSELTPGRGVGFVAFAGLPVEAFATTDSLVGRHVAVHASSNALRAAAVRESIEYGFHIHYGFTRRA